MKKRKLKVNNNVLLVIIVLIIIYIIVFAILGFNKGDNMSDNDKTTSTTTTTTVTTAEEITATSKAVTTTTTTTKKETTTTKPSTTTTTTKKITTTTAPEKTDNGSLTGTSSKGYSITYKDGAYYVDGYMIVNKTYALSKNFVPQNSIKAIPSSGFAREPLNKEAYKAWEEMLSDSKALGLNLWAQSGYRSYDYQKSLYDGYVSRKGKAAADTSSARPGHSEHQTGLAFDLNTITTAFKDTKEGIWVNNNCYLYGYIIRYPENSTNKTGYIFEPWHIRYVGKELAEKLYNNGSWITMEEYFGLTSTYAN